MIYLDTARAFDKVYHPMLIVKLKRLNIPMYLIKLIDSYLSHRTFQIKINEIKSTVRNQESGVPQGSVLGPLLYILFTADIPKLDNVKISIFVDDTAIYTHHVNPHRVKCTLQKSLTIVHDWMSKWRLKLNVNKTEAVFFPAENRRKPKQQLILCDNVIKWSNHAKYLGIWLDSKLSYKKHMTETRKKVTRKINYLYPLLCKNSKLSNTNKLTVYKAIIRPNFLYGIEVGNNANQNVKHIAQITQNKILRMITGAPYYVPNRALHSDMEMETYEEIGSRIIPKTYKKMEHHSNELIRKTFTELE